MTNCVLLFNYFFLTDSILCAVCILPLLHVGYHFFFYIVKGSDI